MCVEAKTGDSYDVEIETELELKNNDTDSQQTKVKSLASKKKKHNVTDNQVMLSDIVNSGNDINKEEYEMKQIAGIYFFCCCCWWLLY